MCGIAGYLKINSQPIQDTSGIISMLKAQKHRGPDDSGIMAFSLKSGESVALNTEIPQAINGCFEGVLGFNRLSILDLSTNGHQPMTSPDGKVLLSLNGEIYNAFDYKAELSDWGYRFKSTSDTEIVLALYLKYGFEGMLTRLNGMFAIVIVDLALGEIYITRDRFGIKPMYYISNEDTFAFSSELKSFQFLDNFNFTLDEKQLDEYLLFRNNLHGTLFKKILSLQAGHFLSFTLKNGVVNKFYFDINKYERSEENSGSIDFYNEKLQRCLSKSVKSQLMSDVKLGCQLSGGIDSSLVTLLANKSSNKGSFEAVSIIFNDSRFNEEQYIDKVARDLSITSHKFLLESNYFLDNIENATWHLEAPLNHPNTIGIYKLSQRAKDYVTVLLSGEGADEVFGGYSRYYDIVFPFRAKTMLHEIKNNMMHPRNFSDYFDHSLRAVMATSFITPSMSKKLKKDFCKIRATSNRISLYNLLTGSVFDRQVKYEMLTYLPDLLIRQDKMSMAHSIENRVPFLDNEVVDNSFTIPEKYLMLRKSPEGYNTGKYILKKMTAEIFGTDFAFREKMGFGIPVREYFLNSGFKEYLNDKIVPGIKRRGIFNFKYLNELLSDIHRLNYNAIEALWIIVSFEIWASIYLDKNHANSHSRN